MRVSRETTGAGEAGDENKRNAADSRSHRSEFAILSWNHKKSSPYSITSFSVETSTPSALRVRFAFTLAFEACLLETVRLFLVQEPAATSLKPTNHETRLRSRFPPRVFIKFCPSGWTAATVPSRTSLATFKSMHVTGHFSQRTSKPRKPICIMYVEPI